MMSPAIFQDLLVQTVALRSAQTPAEVGRIYEALVGYDLHADDPTMTLDELRAAATDYLLEICAAECIPPSAMGLPEADPHARIAATFSAWREFFDTGATMTEEEFDALTMEQRLALLAEAFGTA